MTGPAPAQPRILPLPDPAGTRVWREAAARVAQALSEGLLIGFPTETVYGVGCRADDPNALARLRAWKGRAAGQPFQWLLADPEDARHWAETGPEAWRLMHRFWPGPLTLVLPQKMSTDGSTVGLRCPGDPFIREVVRLSGSPVAASSANRAGDPPAADGRALASLPPAPGQAGLSLVVDCGPLPSGTPSTVARLAVAPGRPPRLDILREGALPPDELRSVLESA